MSDVSSLVHIDPLSYTTVLYMSVSYLMVQNRCGTYVDACQTILYYCSDQCLIQFNYWLRHLVLLLCGWYHDSENIFIKLEKMIVYYPWPEFDCTCVIRAGWWISEVCAYQVRLKHLYIETTVQKDFAQNSIFWKINFKPKIPYLRN